METSMKKLWQDNEILDRTLKSIGPERDFYKDRADRYHALFAASPEALPAVCHDLQQEVERLRRQYAALTSTIERFVNDGLALGVLVKSDNSPDDMSLNVDYQRPPQARAAAPSNVDQNMHQQQPYMNNPSQPQTFAHRTSNNAPEVTPLANQRRHSVPSISPFAHERPVIGISMPGQVLQAQYNAPQSNRVPAQVGIHSHSQPQPRSQPSTTCPYPSPTITHPQRSASSHPSSHCQVQMISQGRPTPFENQPFCTLKNQSSRSSVPPHNRLPPMIPLEHTASLETQVSRPSTPHSYPVPANNQSIRSYASSNRVSPSQSAQNPRIFGNVHQSNPSTVLQSVSRMGPLSTVVYHTPVLVSSSSDVHIAAQVHDVQIDDKKPIQGPAPPTPPQLDRSLSSDQEQYPTLPSPLLIRTLLKRAPSINEGVSLSPSKRMRLDGKEPTTLVHSAKAPTVPRGFEPMLGTGGKGAGITEKDQLVSPSNALASVESYLENVEDPQSNLMSDNPSGPMISNVGSCQTVNNGEAEGSEVDEAGRDKEGKEEGGEDEDETSCAEKEALGEVLKLEHPGNICKLCRSRHDGYPDKYTDADTPTSVLVSHFTTVHPAGWSRLRGSSVPTLTPTAA
ncbi:hypothetical protein F5877DRAFT_85150 [Lentinula edodes]|nr:hypothetical protein F5877DRAFT_85150 [Lentinula edodes]